jgi:hypothetical protein
LRAAATPSSLEVARAGVTTTIVAPYVAGERGARAAALKTAGDGRDEVIVDALCGIPVPRRPTETCSGSPSATSRRSTRARSTSRSGAKYGRI